MKLLFLGLLALAPHLLFAQTVSLRGQVLDETGAFVPGARVSATKSGNLQPAATVTSSSSGQYVFDRLAPGAYVISASTDSLVSGEPAPIQLTANPARLDLRLIIKPHQENVTVQDNDAPHVGTDPASNASSLVLRGEALDALSENPDDLQADLQALAGPSAGPNGGSIYVDDFSGGEIPPKNSIREVRINQDPFSAEFDKLGYGRIEIFTKPGAQHYHGTVDYNLGTDVWNARNPYAAQKAPLLLNEFEGGASGPLNQRSSFTLDAQRNMVDNGSVVNAVTLDPTLTPTPFSSVFKTIQRYTRISPRLDFQLNPNNTLSFRYGVTRGDIDGAGIGSFDLISRGHHTTYTTQTFQATENAVLGTAVNETRFQYYRNAVQLNAFASSPVIQVLGSFNGGGSELGRSADTQNSFEFQNYTSVLHETHAIRFGIRLRALIEDSLSPVNFNGTYTFTGGTVPGLDAANQPVPGSFVSVNSIERYRRTLLFQNLGYSLAQIRALGGGASQFAISVGQPDLSRHQLDFGLFFGDTWRARPNLTVAYGIRYEGQSNISDWRDISPRLSLAWSPPSRRKAQRKTVLRAGFGIFYDRFALQNILAADRYNGLNQRQYVLTNPDTFPNIPTGAELAAAQSPQIVQRVASDLRAPYLMQSAFTLERQLTSNTTAALTYTNSRGLHILRSRDTNAPLPGTYIYGQPGSGTYPLGTYTGPVMLVESSGFYSQNQLIANFNTRLNSAVNIFGFYVFNRARSDTDGVGPSTANPYDLRGMYGTSPANPYNYGGEYGPASTDIHHRVSFGGSLTARWNIRLSPFVVLQSGAPFNLTSGNDLYGTTLFNARPGFASNLSKPGLIQTPYGLLDPTPAAGTPIVPRNYGRGPGQINVNLRFSKSIGLGPEKGAPASSSSPTLSSGQAQAAATGNVGWGRLIGTSTTSRKYNLILSMSARNLLNHNNPGPIVGNITSPLFGRANQIAGNVNGEGFSENASNRRLEMQIRFTF